MVSDVAYALSSPKRSQTWKGSNQDNFVVANPLEASDGHHGHSSPRGDGADNLIVETGEEVAFALNAKAGYRDGASDTNYAIDGESSVRRLTPTECERLQALEDGWTAPDELGGPGVYVGNRCVSGVSDGKRYAALGDAVTASVAEWIGRRLLEVDGR